MKFLRRVRRWYRNAVIRLINWSEHRQSQKAIKAFEIAHPHCRDQDHRLEVPKGDILGMPDPDGRMSLYREALEGRNMREDAGLPIDPPYVAAKEEHAPIYRKDGQIHNFEALSFRKPFTRKQYEARYAGHKPVPKRGAHTLEKK